MAIASPGNRRILVVDRDGAACGATAQVLSRTGYPSGQARGRDDALAALNSRHHDAIVADIAVVLDDGLLAALRERVEAPPLLVMTDADRLDDAVRALREGAADYLRRPPDPHEIRTRLERILVRTELDSRIALLQNEVSRNVGFKDLVAHSPAMKIVLDRLTRVAPLKATVLVHGESGVGKELVARAVHFNSPRREFPFIAINCAAIPANLIESDLFGHERGSFTGAHARALGKFEIAHRGTLFLDEIGEMDQSSQAKLLRVLEQKEFMRVGGDHNIRVDVRVIAATNADLEKRVERGTFRRDLFYRLKVVTINVPPLRERRADIPILVEAFLDELARANAIPPKAITTDALEAIKAYDWPGNVREMKNVLESMLVSSPRATIGVEDLPPALLREARAPERTDFPAGTTLASMEATLIRRTLETTGGNRTHSAELLGIGVRTLQRKIRDLGLDIPPRRRRARRRPTTV